MAAADWPLIRHFRAPHKVAAEPCDDIDAHWVPTTPETIPPQSAVAFFFGETLFRELGVPVGLINCSWGGTRIEPWTPAGGDANKYDFNDKPVPDAVQGLGYGCLQVHDLATKTTVLAFKHFNSSSLPCDVGIGKCTGEHPDWTFARNGGAYKARRLSVWVK